MSGDLHRSDHQRTRNHRLRPAQRRRVRDLSGLDGIDRDGLEKYRTLSAECLSWLRETKEAPEKYLPFGGETAACADAVARLREEIDRYFLASETLRFCGVRPQLCREEATANPFSPESIGSFLENAPAAIPDAACRLDFKAPLNPRLSDALRDFAALKPVAAKLEEGALTLDGGSAVFYLPAVGCLCAALALQYCPYDRIVLYGNIKRALDIETDPAGYRAMLKIAVECCKHGELGEEGVLHLVREEYPSAEGEELRRTAAGLLSRLIHRHRLLELVSDGNGFRLVPNPGIRRVSSPLAGVAQVPRVVFALLLAVLWMLSPIDLIPDAVPLFGVVDDVGVTLLTAGLLFRNRRDAGN